MSSFNSSVADYSALLDTYMYLDIQDKGLRNKSLKDSLDFIKDNYPGKANTEEFKVLQETCENDSNLADMKIVSQSHVDGKALFDYSGSKCTDDPIQACAFKDDNGNLYVAYRGTGKGRWGDNGQGFVDESTDMQEAARDYFDYVAEEHGYNELYVTGHSKGGNEAQYVTMTSKYQDDITACYSIDGQGFSDAAIKKFQENPNYKEILKKMYSVNGDNDPIHKLIGVIIPEENTYYIPLNYKDSEGNFQVGYCHDILGMIDGKGLNWDRDKDGNITHGTEGWLSELGGVLNKNLQGLPTEIKGSCAIAVMEIVGMLTGGSMDDAETNLFDFVTFNTIGIPLVLTSLTEYATIYMYEKYGIAGGIATCIVSSVLATVVGVIIQPIIIIAEAAYLVKKVIDSAIELVNKAKELCKKAGAFANDIFNNIISFANRFKEWLYCQTAGYKYANANPTISINTTTMQQYAVKLRSLSARSKSLDSKMNSLYWNLGISWDSISNLGKLLKAEVILDFATRLDKCAKYLEDTVDDFNKVEENLLNI